MVTEVPSVHAAVSGARMPQSASSGLILVVDTDPGVRWALEKGISLSGYQVRAVTNVSEAMQTARQESVQGVVLELLPEAGLTPEVISMLSETPNAPRVICVSADSAPQLVIECMRRGAADFLTKPFNLAELRAALSRALTPTRDRQLPRDPTERARPEAQGSLLIGISPAMQELRVTVERVAQTDLNCLLRGESGTGKDMVAREIHRLSRRKTKPFVKVNCTALPEQLLESELFGYEKGAFTGAITSKPGRFELANQGIIFLDEIGDMHPNLQAKLLQVIEHKEFTKLGGTRHLRVDVQIIAATNADLEKKTKEGGFRDDLYFRLNEVCIWVPLLAARKEDITLLAWHFIQKHGQNPANARFDVSEEEMATLTAYDWPGNVRELETTIKRWLALGKEAVSALRLGPRQVSKPAAVTLGSYRLAQPAVPQAPPAEQSESQQIRAALERHHWNRRKAADALGMSYRTLRRRIEKFGLDHQP
ncbi:MAG: sigma-54-dependent Fis family transcriptional regulator [Candidatus Hydrogenedentes bacterium]|nr:sigma-54-dependent Fis family transcriptional regulator [Candidatus Hydrogenedentota bacterium]